MIGCETKEECRRRNGREVKARWREANRELSRARSNAYAALHREGEKARSAAWRLANPQRVKELMAASHAERETKWEAFLSGERVRYHANPRPKLDKQKAAKAADPAKFRAREKRFYLANKPKFLVHSAARRARKAHATPVWCDKAAFLPFYQEARRLTLETGVPHEVDHVIPLRGRTVCGLHTPINLQIITRTANRQKFNKVADDNAADRSRVSASRTV